MATLSLAAVDGHKTKSSLTAMLCPGFELTSVKVTVTEKRSRKRHNQVLKRRTFNEGNTG